MATQSSQLSTIVLPVIQLSTDLSQEAHVYLLEDSLHLWLATLHNATECTPQLLDLFQVIPSLIGNVTRCNPPLCFISDIMKLYS